MVFSIASNEHTIKTLLNSRLASNKNITYAPKFSLSTTIYSPLNMVSMVCLESCTILPPSMFTHTLMYDGSNFFQRRTFLADGTAVATQDYWTATGAANANTQGVAGGAPWTAATNLKDIRGLMTTLEFVDMTNMDNVALFLYDFILQTRAISITFGSLPGDGNVANTIFWESNVVNNFNLGRVQAPYQLYNTGGQAWGTANTYAAFTPALLATRLKLMNQINFTMRSVASLDVAGGTSEFRLGGKWLKTFHQNPAKHDAGVAGQYVSFTSAADSPTFTLQNQGYNNLCIHTSFAKSVYTCPSGLSQLTVAPTNILWTVQIISSPYQRTYFTNMNTAGKVSYFMPIMEEIEIYFTDEWGDVVTDEIDFQIMLTFDYSPPDPFPEPETIKRARTKYLL